MNKQQRIDQFNRQQKELATIFEQLGAPHLKMRVMELLNDLMLLELAKDPEKPQLQHYANKTERQEVIARLTAEINEAASGLLQEINPTSPMEG